MNYLKTAASGRYKAGMRSGEAFQFKPGHTPYNKGKKMPAETYEKVKKAMFATNVCGDHCRPD